MLDTAFTKLAELPAMKGKKNVYRDIRILGLRIGYDFETRQIVNPLTLDAIGEKFNLSRERVNHIERDSLMPSLQKILHEMGVDAHYFEEGVDFVGAAAGKQDIEFSPVEFAA